MANGENEMKPGSSVRMAAPFLMALSSVALAGVRGGGLIYPNLGGGTAYSSLYECVGSPLNNPMQRIVCGRDSSEAGARNQCGYNYSFITCYQR